VKYENPEHISKDAAERLFSIGRDAATAEVLVAVALNEPDWRWVERKCLQFLANGSIDVKRVAITCLGHIARILGRLDAEIVLPALDGFRNDPLLAGTVQDAIDDITMFLRSPS
jgi:hypothetical protein